jgi:hypothetical protein
MLFQVREYAEALYPVATALSQIWGSACPSIDSYPYSATPVLVVPQERDKIGRHSFTLLL